MALKSCAKSFAWVRVPPPVKEGLRHLTLNRFDNTKVGVRVLPPVKEGLRQEHIVPKTGLEPVSEYYLQSKKD